MLFSGTIIVHIGVYDHDGKPLAAPTSADVLVPAHIGRIQEMAKRHFGGRVLRGIDEGDIMVHQLNKEHESKFGERIELTEMATKLNFRSKISEEAHLACVKPG